MVVVRSCCHSLNIHQARYFGLDSLGALLERDMSASTGSKKVTAADAAIKKTTNNQKTVVEPLMEKTKREVCEIFLCIEKIFTPL